MAAPTLITELSQTAGSNGPAGSVSPIELDNYDRAHASFIAQLRDGKGHAATASVASATTTDIGAANSLSVEITGTTTITGFGTAYSGPRFLRFAGALILTHSASLALPGVANITTAAGDTCIALPNLAANGWNVVSYERSATLPVYPGANSTITSLTGLGTAELNIGSGQLVKSVTGNLQVGTATNVDARRLLVNGPGSGGVYASIIDPTQTLNEVLMGMEPSTSRTAFQSSLFPLYLNVNGDRMKIDAIGEFSSWCVDALRPMFHTRAWCSFVGSGTPAMRGSGNFSSTITDHGPGEFTLTFTTAMPDANYVVIGSVSNNTTSTPSFSITSQAAGSFRIKVTDNLGNLVDPSIVNVTVVR